MSESHDRAVNILGALTLALADRMRHAIEDAAGQSAAAPAALVALQQFIGGGTMDELGRVVGLTPSGAVRLVDRLVSTGLVERRPGPDGRSLALVLTSSGRRAARRVLAARAEALDGALGGLTEDERALLARLTGKVLRTVTLQRLADRREGHDPPGGWLCRLCDPAACGRGRGDCPAAAAGAQFAG